MAVGLLGAAAEQGDGPAPGAAAERVDRLGTDLPPVASHVPAPGQTFVLEGVEQFARRGDVAVPLVDSVPSDPAGPEAHDQDAGPVGGFRRVVDPLDFHHLFL